MINFGEVLQTIEMIDQQHLDIRTITMGISIRDCAHPNPKICCQKIYDKITSYAGSLVKTGEEIEREFGIPIVNKRISVTPVAIACESCDTEDYVPFAMALDRAAKEVGVNFIGGFFRPCTQKGLQRGRTRFRCHPPSTFRNRPGLLKRQRGHHKKQALTWTRWPKWAALSRTRQSAPKRERRHGLRQARCLCQRRRGQPLYGRRVSRCRRAGVRNQRGGFRPRCRP